MRLRYERTHCRAAFSHCALSPPSDFAATAALAARRLRSHSQGPTYTSSKSLIEKTRLRSADAYTPKLLTCISPHAATGMPDTGRVDRSLAITAADPRRKANGLVSIRP